MGDKSVFAEFPERVSAGTGRKGAYYVRAADHYAVRSGAGKREAAAAELSFKLEGMSVYKGEPAKTKADAESLTPVYRLQPDGPLAVPTGKIFLRFKEGVEVATRREEIERAGYEITETPPYAPSSAWVRAIGGDVARSLSDIEALEKLADVENVEPQMLVERAMR
ncbi:MAG: hypothetical protein ABW250_27855 [Pyrinomonadaceae bacterium]